MWKCKGKEGKCDCKLRSEKRKWTAEEKERKTGESCIGEGGQLRRARLCRGEKEWKEGRKKEERKLRQGKRKRMISRKK